MSIQIVDNFSLGTDKPIDNRFVVGPGQFYLNRDSIENKYIGLRIWDINDDSAYIWKGSAWESETLSAGDLTSVGTAGKIPKFTSSTTIGDSIMEEQSGKVVVTGILQASSFQGIGTGITQINASNISTGVLNVSRLQGSLNQIIVGQGLGYSSSWTDLDDITVGNSSKINLENTTDSSIHYLTMGKNATTSQTIYTSESLKYYPSSGKMILNGSLSVGTELDPPDSGLLVDGSVRLTGLEQFSSGISAPKLTVISSGTDFSLKLDTGTTIPIGGIILWMQSEIPEGFVLCDGSVYYNSYLDQTISTPDLRSNFPIGSSNDYTLGGEGTMNASSTGDDPYGYIGINFIMYVGYPNQQTIGPGDTTSGFGDLTTTTTTSSTTTTTTKAPVTSETTTTTSSTTTTTTITDQGGGGDNS